MTKTLYIEDSILYEKVILRLNNIATKENDIIEESVKQKLVKTMSAVMIASSLFGVPIAAKKISSSLSTTKSADVDAINKIINDNSNASSETISRLKNGLRLAKMYNKYKSNKYLKSVFITYLFSQNKTSYSNLGISGKRTTKISYKQRYILFYENVIGKKISDSDIDINKIKRECQKHPEFEQYAEMISQIKEKAGSNNITFWLTPELAKSLGVEGDEVYWCGIFAGSVVGDTTGDFASTVKFSKSINSTAYYQEGNKKLKDNKEHILSTFLKPGDVLTLAGYKAETTYGGHFAIVYKVEKDSNNNIISITTLEGNVGQDQIMLTRRSPKEVKIATSFSDNTVRNEKIVNDINDAL